MNAESLALAARSKDLALSRSLLRATLEVTNDAIVVTGDSGGVTDFNPQFLEMWRLSAASIVGVEYRSLLERTSMHFVEPESFVIRAEAIIASVAESSDELHLLDGRVIERFSKIQILDERPVGRVWSFRDVTDQRRAEEALREAADLCFRLAAIVESSDDAIISKTLEGIISTWNLGAEKMFGYTSEEIVGRSITTLIPPEISQEERDILSRLRRGEHVDHYETVRVRKDGVRINVSLSVSPIKDQSGSIVGASKISRNITDRIRSEQALKAAALEREQLLAAERAARSEAERVSVMKDEFLATLSHELRTPLNAILGWAKLLSSGKLDAAATEQGVDAIQRNARTQAQLIEDLLDMSRIISGKVRLDVQWIDLADVVESAVEAVRPTAEAKEIRLRKIVDPKAGPVSGDPTRLQQVIWNLLSNAIKFTPKGGSVEVILERVNSHLEITVHDSGIGIKPEFLPLVFERFRQADSSTTRAYAGLGLGLSIVKNLVELHGGSVCARSEGEGQGATFVVALPLAPLRMGEKREHPTASKAAPIDSMQLDLSGLKVLIVDDEPDARALLTRVLKQCHADVSTAVSAEDGLEQVRSFRPEIIVSDIGMPEADGYEFIRRVRALSASEGGRTPAIALTAFARSEDRTRAMISGYQVHIAKPIEPQELVATVGSLAGRTSRSDG